MPPIAYMLKCRIEAAQQILTSTEMCIVDIAASVGFSSANHFSQTVKLLTGCTPSAYRRTATYKAAPLPVFYPPNL